MLTALCMSAVLCSCRESAPAHEALWHRLVEHDSVKTARYEQARFPSADGIGKLYMGREIAKVMGHWGAMWLERPERASEERPDIVLQAMELNPTDAVADIGAGTGYFTFRIAERVPKGKVYAVDIQPEMLNFIKERMQKTQVTNIIPTLGTEQNPNLPENSLDKVLLVDAYHEFEYPYEMMQEVFKSLKVGGRVIQVEYRAEDDSVPIKPLHKMSEAQAKKEMQAVGLKWVTTKSDLPWQHILIFEKPAVTPEPLAK
jgi:precorrin-6B methylase 2